MTSGEQLVDAIQFFNSDIVDLPKERDQDDFVAYAKRILDEYRTQMQRVTNDSLVNKVITTRIDLVSEVSGLLIQCIEHYFRGHPVTAYQTLDQLLNKLGPHFDVLCPSGDMSEFINPLYRLRLSGPAQFPRRDLFHIPFQLRHIVGPMRYSIPGLPALYLGGSTFVCHLELGSLNPATFSAARYEAVTKTNLRVLNFGRRPAVIAAWIASDPKEFSALGNGAAVAGSLVATWPLLALCSIRKRHPDARFHAEYVVPQLMLQWITNTRAFHGIRYFSTHYKEYHDDPKTYMNYVFPARTVHADGYCPELTGLFRLTEPMTWPQAKAGVASTIPRPQYKHHGKLIDELEKEFGYVESVLLGMPTAAV